MNVHLTPELEELVQSKVQTGRYQSPSAVVADALRLLEERDELLQLRREEIGKKIAEGTASLRRGERVDGETVFEGIEAALDGLESSEQDQTPVRAARLAGFREELDRRLASLAHGEGLDGEKFFAQLAREEAVPHRKRRAK